MNRPFKNLYVKWVAELGEDIGIAELSTRHDFHHALALTMSLVGDLDEATGQQPDSYKNLRTKRFRNFVRATKTPPSHQRESLVQSAYALLQENMLRGAPLPMREIAEESGVKPPRRYFPVINGGRHDL